MNDDRDSVKGSQHTACVIQPISLFKRSTYGTLDKKVGHTQQPPNGHVPPQTSPEVQRKYAPLFPHQ